MTSTFDFVILYCNLQPPTLPPPTLPPPTWRRRSESSWKVAGFRILNSHLETI